MPQVSAPDLVLTHPYLVPGRCPQAAERTGSEEEVSTSCKKVVGVRAGAPAGSVPVPEPQTPTCRKPSGEGI